MKVKIMSTKSRNYFLDNYKALLIVLVVTGHFIEPCSDNHPILQFLKWGIFSFHMPAFIFISGYFSKKKMSFKKLVQKLIIPYLMYEMIYYLLYVFVIHKDTGLYLNRPKFSLWYLMALFFWRIATPYIRKIPGNIFIAITAGLLIGFTQLGNFFSIPRTLFFYPFFLAGYYFQEDWFKAVRKNWKPFAAGLAGFLTLFLAVVSISGIRLTPHIFYGRYSYQDMGLTPGTGMLIRLGCYGISFLMVFVICALIPGKKHFFSILGIRTMPVYLFHGLIYSALKTTPVLKNIDTLPEIFLLLSACILLSFALASKPFNWFVDKISSLPVNLPNPVSGMRFPPVPTFLGRRHQAQ